LEKMMNKDPVKPISLETFEEEMGMRFTSHATSESYKVTKNRRSKLRNIIKEGEPAIRLPKGVRLEPVVNKQGEKVLARPSAEPRARRGSLAHEARRRKSINRWTKAEYAQIKNWKFNQSDKKPQNNYNLHFEN
jgi:hypothetical protein